MPFRIGSIACFSYLWLIVLSFLWLFILRRLVKLMVVLTAILVLALSASALKYETTAGTLVGFGLFWLGLTAVWVAYWLFRRFLYRRAVHDYGEGEAARLAWWWQTSQIDTVGAVVTIFVFFLASVKVLAMMVRASNGGAEWEIVPSATNHTHLTLDRTGQQPPFMEPGQHCPADLTGE